MQPLIKVILVLPSENQFPIKHIAPHLLNLREDYDIQIATPCLNLPELNSDWEVFPSSSSILEGFDQVWIYTTGTSNEFSPEIHNLLSQAYSLKKQISYFSNLQHLIDFNPVDKTINNENQEIIDFHSPLNLNFKIALLRNHNYKGDKSSSRIQKLHSKLIDILHPLRVALIPAGSIREERYYIFRQNLRRVYYFVPDNLWRKDTVKDYIRWQLKSIRDSITWNLKSLGEILYWRSKSISDINGRVAYKVKDTLNRGNGSSRKWSIMGIFKSHDWGKKQDNVIQSGRRMMLMPSWWSQTATEQVFEQLDQFWAKYSHEKEFVIYITSSPLHLQQPFSKNITTGIQIKGTPLVYVPFRFSPKDQISLGECAEGKTFQLPLDFLWANPDKVFYSKDMQSNMRLALIIDFPHPAMFRIVTIARLMGWKLIYEPADDWRELQRNGLAKWYDPWFEHYLSANVDYDLSINPLWEEKDRDSIWNSFETIFIPYKYSGSEIPHRLIPEWWERANKDEKAFLELKNFIKEQNFSNGCVMIFSGVLFTQSEGQRSTWLTRAFSQMNIPVIFCYFRFQGQEKPQQDAIFPNVHQYPIDQLWKYPAEIISIIPRSPGKRIFLAEFPHPSLIRLMNIFNAYDWITIYETIDNWQEFSNVGQAEWYNNEIEAYIMHNSQFLSATSEPLMDMVYTISERNAVLLPNAFEPGTLSKAVSSMNLPRGTITIGYFGHLTSSWFDWDLIITTANNHPDWIFHIIGYGADTNLSLPDNVLMLGKVAHNDLPRYSTNWDVAIIPFKTTSLTLGVNPIKVYEYLELRLPVVACGMPHLTKMPYVQNAETYDEFERMIISAHAMILDPQVIETFLSCQTWMNRATTILSMKGN